MVYVMRVYKPETRHFACRWFDFRSYFFIFFTQSSWSESVYSCATCI